MAKMLTLEEGRYVSAMVKGGRLMPDELFHVPAMQSLAMVAARYGALMTEEHLSWLIGAGAILAHHAEAEMAAEVAARMALAKAGKGEG